jgi:hypothetical protein
MLSPQLSSKINKVMIKERSKQKENWKKATMEEQWLPLVRPVDSHNNTRDWSNIFHVTSQPCGSVEKVSTKTETAKDRSVDSFVRE